VQLLLKMELWSCGVKELLGLVQLRGEGEDDDDGDGGLPDCCCFLLCFSVFLLFFRPCVFFVLCRSWLFFFSFFCLCSALLFIEPESLP
jgi:hypothetical protein